MNSVTYILYEEKVNYVILVDCGQFHTLEPVLESLGRLEVKAVLLTHGHSDHIWGLKKLIKVYPNVVICASDCGHEEIHDSKKNLSFYHDTAFTIEGYCKRVLKDGEILHFEGFSDIEVLATPGHDMSCLTYKLGDNIFTGDSYIPGIKVFSNFPRGNKQQAIASQEKLVLMEKNGCKVYCGHHDYEGMI